MAMKFVRIEFMMYAAVAGRIRSYGVSVSESFSTMLSPADLGAELDPISGKNSPGEKTLRRMAG
jgi:hypothetical protein